MIALTDLAELSAGCARYQLRNPDLTQSDRMPTRPGWTPRIGRVAQSIPGPGLCSNPWTIPTCTPGRHRQALTTIQAMPLLCW